MRIIEISKILKDNPNLKHKFEDLLPELIRKLIKETSLNIIYNRFPSRDATNTPGVDGIVKNSIECEFIPVGDSFWEIGTSGLSKIIDDYNKRTEEFIEEIRLNTTFILIFPKYWSFNTSLVDWQNQRKSQWKDVIVYDAEILNNWMEEHPNISLWFLKELGITPKLINYKLVETEYEDLINCTNPKLTSQIFCESRELDKEKFFNDLYTKNIVYVKSESRFESLGFILSSILENKCKIKNEDCLVVYDRDSYNFLNKTLKNKILILNFEDTNELKIENNKIIMPCYKNNFTGNGIELKIRGQRTMSKLLTDMGLKIQESTDVNYKSNGNLLIIRRLLAKDIIDKQPKWANSQDTFCIIPLLLLQTFDVTNSSHIKIAEYITDYNKELYLQKLSTFQDIEDCPFRVVGNFYQLYNIEESWFVIKKFMSILFEKIFKVLEFIYLNKQPNNTIKLISEGLTNSNLDSILKIIAFYAIDSEENQYYVDTAISSILDLEKCNKNLINKNLHILAECSPEKVCSFLEKQIKQKTDYLLDLLQSNDYCYLLSPINYLLTLEKYKFRAINLLFELSSFDVKYFYSNNPKKDLKEALMPQFNNNALSVKEKQNILKSKIDQNINMIELYIKIITSTTCCVPIYFNVRKPEYSIDPTYKELGNFRKELDVVILEKIFKTTNIEMILKIIDNYYFFSKDMFTKICDYLKNYRENLNDEALYRIYKLTINKLTTILRFQRDENWINNKKHIAIFYNIIENAKPKDIFLQYKYMFEDYSDYIDIEDNGNELNWDELKNKNYILRTKALNFIMKYLGKEKTIISFIENVSDDCIWSMFLLELFNDTNSFELIFDLCIKNNKFYILSGVMNQISDKTICIKIFKEKINFQIKNNILPLLNLEEYEVLCDNCEELEIFYSKKSVGFNSDCTEEKYEKFLKYNPVGLLDYFYQKVYDDKLYNKGLALLNSLKTRKSAIEHSRYLWELKNLFKDMEAYKYSEELALLELDYIDIFDHLYPNAIVEYWFKNPTKFINYFKEICEDKEKHYYINKLQFDLKFKANHYRDESSFVYFYDSILKEENTLLNIIFGCVIGKSCIGSDGIFPHETVRLILENNNECINKHFITGYINSIGVRVVDSGKEEFDKAKKFEENAKILAIKYPITSSLLINLSNFHKDTGNKDKKYDLLGI